MCASLQGLATVRGKGAVVSPEIETCDLDALCFARHRGKGAVVSPEIETHVLFVLLDVEHYSCTSSKA